MVLKYLYQVEEMENSKAQSNCLQRMIKTTLSNFLAYTEKKYINVDLHLDSWTLPSYTVKDSSS